MRKKNQTSYLFICGSGNRKPKHGRIISHLSVYCGVSNHPKEMKKIRINPKHRPSQREHVLHSDTVIIP